MALQPRLWAITVWIGPCVVAICSRHWAKWGIMVRLPEAPRCAGALKPMRVYCVYRSGIVASRCAKRAWNWVNRPAQPWTRTMDLVPEPRV